MTSFIRRHVLKLAAGAVVLAALAWLAFGYFGVHTHFIDQHVDEAPPVFAASTAPATPSPTNVPTTPAAPGPADTSERVGNSAAGATDRAQPPNTQSPETTVPAATASGGEVTTELAGTFVSEAHPTRGTTLVLSDGGEQRFLRLEDFETDNGPDLNVYLVNSDDPSDYVDLGDLKGNIGSQNYEIPPDVDLTRYDTVSIWCVRFSVGFGSATLQAA